MLRFSDKFNFHRIEIYVFNFLSEYFLAVDHLRMKTFLPKLIFTIGFMLQFVILKLIKKPVFIISFKQINYRPGSITLYWCNGLTKIISTENWVEMIVENYIRIYFKILFSLWIFERAGENMKISFACKNRNPFLNCRGDKVEWFLIDDPASAFHDFFSLNKFTFDVKNVIILLGIWNGVSCARALPNRSLGASGEFVFSDILEHASLPGCIPNFNGKWSGRREWQKGLVLKQDLRRRGLFVVTAD